MNLKVFKRICMTLVSVACATLLATGCGNTKAENATQSTDRNVFYHEDHNSIYYWKTTLDPTPGDSLFLRNHNIRRAYIRMFDIVPDHSPIAMDAVVPNATIVVRDTLPVSEVVPVVYITDEAIKSMKGQEGMWAQKIAQRVANMCSYNDFGRLREIQLDCDWTAETRDSFFELCDSLRSSVRRINPDGGVSATIRLHQLAQSPPPVDYGVLMLYNTGSFSNPDTENSIISVDDVKPYLKNLKTYGLHLDFAYPTYGWNLVFRDNMFLGLLRDDLSSLNGSLKRTAPNKHKLTRDIIIGEMSLHKGDEIRHEDSAYAVVSQVKQLIEQAVGNKPHSNILYHYDAENLSGYTDAEITALYK